MRKLKSLKTGVVYTELYSDEEGSLLALNGSKAWWSNYDIKDRLVEYKEPKTITIWKNVWRRKDGSIFFGCDWEDEESAKRDRALLLSGVATCIDTVSFTYTEKEEEVI